MFDMSNCTEEINEMENTVSGRSLEGRYTEEFSFAYMKSEMSITYLSGSAK